MQKILRRDCNKNTCTMQFLGRYLLLSLVTIHVYLGLSCKANCQTDKITDKHLTVIRTYEYLMIFRHDMLHTIGSLQVIVTRKDYANQFVTYR